MKAIVYTKYGSADVLRQAEVPEPTPLDDQILVRVRAVGLNAADWRLMRADPFFVRFSEGLFGPKNHILGSDIAGTIEAVGKDVTGLQPGDNVYGDLSNDGRRGLAEFVCPSAQSVSRMPRNLSFEDAAAVPMAAITALQGLRTHGKIKPEQRVLIHGASGGVGTFALQLAKALGAEVTAVCSTNKITQARSLGADSLIDYTKEDFTQNGQTYDLIFAANGNRPLADYIGALSPTGRYVMAGGSMKQIFQAMLLGPLKSKANGKKVLGYTAKPEQADLRFITELIEAGMVKPVVDRVYPLRETAEAMHYLDQGSAMGKIVVTLPSEKTTS